MGPYGDLMKTQRLNIERGNIAPDLINNPEPEIWVHLLYLWNSFHELSTERSVGMGVGPIPLSKVREYLREELELDEEYEHAYAVLRRLDSEYVTLANRSDKDKARAPQATSSKPLSPKASNGKRGKRSR